MEMWNIKIRADRVNEENKTTDYIVVVADTERFGKNEVMFEGNTWNQCFNYIKRELGIERVPLRTYVMFDGYTDREGRTFPWEMSVVI